MLWLGVLLLAPPTCAFHLPHTGAKVGALRSFTRVHTPTHTPTTTPKAFTATSNCLHRPTSTRVYALAEDSNNAIRSVLQFFEQRIESIKVSVISAAAGGLAFLPVGLLTDFLAFGSLPQLEFTFYMTLIECALFGILYRYAASEENPQLRNGAIAAFTLTRALSSVQVSRTCQALPLRCGSPLGLLDWSMSLSLGANLVASFVAFSVAAQAIEWAMDRDVIGPWYHQNRNRNSKK